MLLSKYSPVMKNFRKANWHANICLLLSRCCNSTPQENLATRPLSEMTVKNFEKIPGPGGLARWPVIGAAFLFKPFTQNSWSRPDLMAINLHQKYGDIVRLQLPYGSTVFLKDPKDMMTVIENEGRAPTRPNFQIIMTYLKSRNVKTLATLQGDEWRRLRMKAQPIFLRPGSADPYLPAIGDVARDFVNYLQGHKSDDFRDVIFLYILECLYQFCFNQRLGALQSSGARDTIITVQKVKDLIAALIKPAILPWYKLWKTKQYKTIESSMDHLVQISSLEVRRAIQCLQNNDHRDIPHFIRSLLTSTDLTEQEVIMTMSDFFFGGTDTTAKNLSMLFYHLARHPQQQKIMYQEMTSVIGSGPVTRANIDKLEYMKACAKESMRLAFPLAPGPGRFLQQDLILSGYHVPKGTLATLCNVAYLHDPQYVKNPGDFSPERWLRDKDRLKKESIPTVCFLPFGIGARMCLGKRFAEMIMYMCLIQTMQKYELKLKDETLDAQLIYEIFPTINKPMKIDFIPRPST